MEVVNSLFSWDFLQTFAGMTLSITVIMSVLSAVFTDWMERTDVRNAVAFVLSIAIVMFVSLTDTDVTPSSAVIAFLNACVVALATVQTAKPVQAKVMAYKAK